MRVSLASTLNRAMTLTASTNDKSGRSASGTREEHGSSGGQQATSAAVRLLSRHGVRFLLINYYTILCISVKRMSPSPPTAADDAIVRAEAGNTAASVTSTDAPRRDLRGSMRFCTLVTLDS